MRIKLPIPTLLHPITGQPLEPQIFIGKRGQVVTVPVVMGGAPDGDEGGTGAQSGDGTGSGGAGTGEGAGTGGTGDGGVGDGGTGSTEGDGKAETVSRKEFEDVLNRMKAADQRASKLEDEKKQAERAKLDETERTKVELQEAQEVNAKLKEQVQDLEKKLAWSTAAGTVAWHDPEDALTIAERKGVFAEVMNDKGEVDGKKLKAAVEKFVQGHKHLVNANGNGTKETKQPNTVTSVGSKTSQTSTAKDDAALAKRYGLPQ